MWADLTHCIHSNGESNTIKLSHANEHIRRYASYRKIFLVRRSIMLYHYFKQQENLPVNLKISFTGF